MSAHDKWYRSEEISPPSDIMPLYSHSTIIPLNNPFQGWNAKVITVIIHQKYIEHKKVIVEVFISWGVIPSEMGQFWTVRLKNQLFGPKQVSYTPLGASGPFLTLEGHFSVKIGNFWFLGLSGTQNFK